MNILKVGDTVRIFSTTYVNNVVGDPLSLRLEITLPDTSVHNYVWNTNVELVRTALGQFMFDLAISQQGTYLAKWFANGDALSFAEETIVTSRLFSFRAVDDDSVAIPFVNFSVRDEDENEVASGKASGIGDLTLWVTPGSHTVVASKRDWKFNQRTVDLIVPGTVPDVSISGTKVLGGWLLVDDLVAAGGSAQVDRLFSETGKNTRNGILLQQVRQEAETLAESYLLAGWSREQIINLAFHDDALRMQAAWVALELASERRPEFVAADGKGRYWAQYERAIVYFQAMAKAKLSSRGEAAPPVAGIEGAGTSAQRRGARLPSPVEGNNFIFADEGNGKTHGGF